MMEPSEFAAKWQVESPPIGESDPLVTLKSSVIEGKNIPAEAKRFLVEAGLPQRAAPFLTFSDLAKGLLPIWKIWGVPDDWGAEDRSRLARYLVVGSDGSGNPICIDEAGQGQVVLLDHEDWFSTVTFVNSGIPQLAGFVLAYREMVAQAQAENGADASLEGNVPEPLRRNTIREFERIDAAAYKEGCFWWYEVQASAAI